MGKRTIIVIPDIHGKDVWKQIVENKADLYIFLGDYFDSFTHTAEQQIENFNEIVEFSKSHNAVMLKGNHDQHYFPHCSQRYSGFQQKACFMIRHTLSMADLKICHIEGNYIFSHAGVTKTFLLENDISVHDISEYYKYRPSAFEHQGPNPYGDSINEGPLWVRPKSLIKDKIDGYIQVVGHTSFLCRVFEQGIHFTDVLDNQLDFLTLKI